MTSVEGVKVWLVVLMPMTLLKYIMVPLSKTVLGFGIDTIIISGLINGKYDGMYYNVKGT